MLGTTASVEGLISPLKPEPAVGKLWVALVAYAADGSVVGVRRWEWQGNLGNGESLEFVSQVFSFGPEIYKVEILVEAQPVK